jgi:hypothetical protein
MLTSQALAAYAEAALDPASIQLAWPVVGCVYTPGNAQPGGVLTRSQTTASGIQPRTQTVAMRLMMRMRMDFPLHLVCVSEATRVTPRRGPLEWLIATLGSQERTPVVVALQAGVLRTLCALKEAPPTCFWCLHGRGGQPGSIAVAHTPRTWSHTWPFRPGSLARRAMRR